MGQHCSKINTSLILNPVLNEKNEPNGTMGTSSSNATSDDKMKQKGQAPVTTTAGSTATTSGGGGLFSSLTGPPKEYLLPFGSTFTTRADSQANQWILDESMVKNVTLNRVIEDYVETVLSKLTDHEVQILLVSHVSLLCISML
jgi:hypothetical protein